MVIDPSAFQRNLRRILKEKNLTQSAFIAQNDLCSATVWNWCNGVLPMVDNLAMIAKILDVSADDLLEGMVVQE